MTAGKEPRTDRSPWTRPELRPIDRLIAPIQSFTEHKLAGAALLMLATGAALFWANSAFAPSYHHLLEMPIGLTLGGISLSKSLHHWINDGLMGIFFFLVGLEIKRELLAGELSSMRKATLPAVAAIGGMAIPAALYLTVNPSGPSQDGWGIPMATDIAFALGVLALLGDRVPLGLKVFLTALAIVDDIGAVLVIAIFYTSSISWVALGAGAFCLLCSIALNASGTRNAIAYFLFGTAAWLGFLESGVHATVAALLMAFTIPARTRIDGEDFVERMTSMLDELSALGLSKDPTINSPKHQVAFEHMNVVIDYASAPLQRIEHALTGPVTFLVLPIFALANAGVSLGEGAGEALASPIVLGIALGLVAGKAVGISFAAWLAVKLRIADLPAGVRWPHVIGAGLLGGIGFTMALFIATLAFEDPEQVEAAKIGILGGSLVSALLGTTLLALTTRPNEPTAAPPPPDAVLG